MRKMKGTFGVVLSLLLCLSMVFPTGLTAFADTEDTLIWNDGDVISESVAISSDTQITVTGIVTVSAEITINSGNVTLSGGGTLLRSVENTSGSMLRISGGNVVLDHITIDGNNVEFTNVGYSTANSAVMISGGTVTLNDGAVIQNSVKRKSVVTEGGGAAICAKGNANIVMNGGALQNNISHRRGGAVYLEGGAVMTINGGSISGNRVEPDTDGDSVYGGGGIYVRDAELNITGGTIANNTALLRRASGGGIYNSSYGTTKITGGTISGNSAVLEGDGVYHSSKEGVSAVFAIGGEANIEDEIYLSSDTMYKYSQITSALKNNVKFTVADAMYDRVIAEGDNYTLTNSDMAKMNVTNSDMALRLSNNQISLSNTAETYSVYFAYDANGGSENVPTVEEIEINDGSDLPVRMVDFSTIPTREGYVFLGWDTDKNAAVPAYTQELGEQTITITENTTLYAVWEAVPSAVYTITATAENGGTVYGGGEVEDGGSVTLTAVANEGYTFDGWYDGETKVCDTETFTVENVTADKTYTARFTQNTVEEPDPEPSAFDFTSIRTARANTIVVDHENKTISMNSDSGVKNIVIYHEQLTVIPGGSIRLADAMGTAVTQNSGSFYIINNAGNAEVLVDVTIDNVTEQYTLTVNFSAFVAENLRMYQRKVGSSEKDIVYGTDVGYITGNTIYITTDPGVEYIGLTKHQGTPGNYNGIMTPADDLPVYTTAEESLAAEDYLYVDYQGCIFVRKPADDVIAEFEINYELNGEVSIYKVIVDYSNFAEGKFDFDNIRAERLQGVEVDHTAKSITAYADKNVKNIAVYSYQIPVIDGGRITLDDSVSDANIIKNANSFYVVNNGQETTTVPVNVQVCEVTQQYELTVVFPDDFDFTDIRVLRAKNVVVDHENKTIELTSDGLVNNIAVYNAQTTVIPNGKITLADAGNAEIVANTGSFYINNIGNEQETVWVDISINGSVKRYSLTVNFSDGFDFDGIRLLRAEGVTIDHAAKKISISAAEGAGNVAIYELQTGVIANGRITLKDAMEASVKQNTGSFYILPPSEGGVSIVTVDVTVGDKTVAYEVEVSF